MSFIKKHKSKIIFAAAVVIVLAVSFCFGMNFSRGGVTQAPPEATAAATVTPTDAVMTPVPEAAADNTEAPAPQKTAPPAKTHTEEQAVHSQPQKTDIGKNIAAEESKTDAVIPDAELKCTMSVRCDTILQNIDHFDKEKVELIPQSGIIFPEQTVVFNEGESVFDLLLRETKENKIHLEFVNTPVYDSAYIEGIGNIYEFDCGELSGWMYKVNGAFPSIACSEYKLHNGDRVEWVYTCDLGKDVGGAYSAGNGN